MYAHVHCKKIRPQYLRFGVIGVILQAQVLY